MNNHRFTLQPYKGPASRYVCPACKDKRKTFVRYIDTDTGTPLAEHVGRCSRQEKCGYHHTPKQYLAAQHNPSLPVFKKGLPAWKRAGKELAPASYIPTQLREQTEGHYEQNNLVQYLRTTLSAETVERLCATYHIGTSKHWPGASIFWQIDEKGYTRSGKIMLYNPQTGKRIKEPFSHISWVHKLKDGAGKPLYPDYDLRQCLFGEHLLNTDKDKWVAIVESEKTAMIASVFLPRYIWLATGSLSGLTKERCKPLKDRTVVIYPDLGSYDKWVDKARLLFFNYTVSDVFEREATPEQRAQGGLDIADVLVG